MKILHIVPKSLLQIKFEFRDRRSIPLAAILVNPTFCLLAVSGKENVQMSFPLVCIFGII